MAWTKKVQFGEITGYPEVVGLFLALLRAVIIFQKATESSLQLLNCYVCTFYNLPFLASSMATDLSTYLCLLFSFSVPGCTNVAMVGNGFCNDETNNVDCNYDGGDCCVVNANTNSCSDCSCHLIETCAAGYHPLVGNEFCNDETNIADCDYDGGDCCGDCTNTDHCLNCVCYAESPTDPHCKLLY